MWKWAITAGLTGYFILHPVVMIIGHLMTEQGIVLSMEHALNHEIKLAFSEDMLPWSLAFTLGAAIFGGLYGRLKDTERVLRHSRIRYQTVVDNQLEYICRFLPDGRCTFVNDAICRLTGFPRQSLLNHSLFTAPEFGDSSEWRSRVEGLSPDHPKTAFEQRLKLPEDEVRWIRWIIIAIPDRAGKIVEYQSVGRDISALKQAQHQLENYQKKLERRVRQRTRALDEAVESLQLEIQERIALEKDIRESELKYRLLFESAPMGIALTTYGGRFLAANTTLLQMLKIDGDALDDIDVRTLYAHREDRTRLLDLLQDTSVVEEADVILRRRDGSTFHAGLSLVRFMLDDRDTILAVVNDISPRIKAIEALQRSETDLHQLSARLMTVQEEERKRIARDLHDSVGQLMHAMKFALETALKQLDGPEGAAGARASLEQMMPVLKEAAAENRRIVMDLRPSMLDDLGLLATINWFCREFGNIYKNIAIEKNIEVEEGDIPVDLRVVCYRIIQEAFNNMAKHSLASRVRLAITTEADVLEVEIEDNGVGLHPEVSRSGQRIGGGFGLPSMRERARASGGFFELTGSAGAGTRIRVVWPNPARPEIKDGLDWQI